MFTIPHSNIITPIAFIKLCIKFVKLFITANGSVLARTPPKEKIAFFIIFSYLSIVLFHLLLVHMFFFLLINL